LLLWGFVPQPNPADAVVVFSSLQDMAACYFDLLEFKLTAGSPAEKLLQSEQFFEAMRLQLAAVSSRSGSGDGFRHMTVDASGIDGRLKTALAVLHAAIAAAAASVLQQQQHPSSSSSSSSSSSATSSSGSTDHSRPQHDDVAAAAGSLATPRQPIFGSDAADNAALVRQLQQVKLGELLVFRLECLARDLDQSCESCTSAIAQLLQQQELQHNSSSSKISKQQQPQQQQQQTAAELSSQTVQQHAAAGGSAVDLAAVQPDSSSSSSSSRYQPSAEHLELIHAYCSSKAALARQLAGGYPLQMAGVFLL
jgi:hypothetical protein